MGLLGQPVHGTGHAIHEEGFRRFLAAMAVGRSHQFFGLGHCQGGKETWEDCS